jgi:transcriptional regulator of acetoin/glycerol metabolism
LRNTIRTSLALCDDGIIRVCDLPAEIAEFRQSARDQPATATHAAEPQARVSLESAERGVLLRVIEQHQWVMSRVAAHFGISRNTLYRKIKRHGI